MTNGDPVSAFIIFLRLIYLFGLVGLCYSKWGLLFVAMHRLLTEMASRCGAWALGCRGFSSCGAWAQLP